MGSDSAVGTRKQSNFERKLASYLIAGSALLATAEDGRADVIYSGPLNTTLGPGTFNLDLNSDSVVDYQFDVNNLFLEVFLTPLGGNQYAGLNASALPAGVPLPGSQSFFSASTELADFKFATGNFRGASNQFLGLQFTISGSTHYGWAELSMPDIDNITLHGYAYENVADAPILTGETSTSAVPEPSPFFLLALGAVGLEVCRRLRRKPDGEAAS